MALDRLDADAEANGNLVVRRAASEEPDGTELPRTRSTRRVAKGSKGHRREGALAAGNGRDGLDDRLDGAGLRQVAGCAPLERGTQEARLIEATQHEDARAGLAVA